MSVIKKILALCVILIWFTSCDEDCDNRVVGFQALTNQYLSFMPFDDGEIIAFENEVGNRLEFAVDTTRRVEGNIFLDKIGTGNSHTGPYDCFEIIEKQAIEALLTNDQGVSLYMKVNSLGQELDSLSEQMEFFSDWVVNIGVDQMDGGSRGFYSFDSQMVLASDAPDLETGILADFEVNGRQYQNVLYSKDPDGETYIVEGKGFVAFKFEDTYYTLVE